MSKLEVTETSQFDIWWKQKSFRVFVYTLVFINATGLALIIALGG